MSTTRVTTRSPFLSLGLLLCTAVACGSAPAAEGVCASYADKAAKCTGSSDATKKQTFLTTCRQAVAEDAACKEAMTKAATCLTAHSCTDITGDADVCGNEMTAVTLACPSVTDGATPAPVSAADDANDAGATNTDGTGTPSP